MKRIVEWLFYYWEIPLFGSFVLIIVLAVAGARNTKNRYAEAGWQKVSTHSFVDNNGDSVLIKPSGKHTDIYVKKN